MSHRTPRRTLALAPLLAAALLAACTEAAPRPTSTPAPTTIEATETPTAAVECDPTIPNASTPPGQRAFPTQHGNARLWVVLALDGKPSIGPGGYGRSGDGAAAKFGVHRADPNAEITIEGHRLDADAPPLEADVIDGYDGGTFQAAALRFPTLGCWEITVRGGDDALTVVMLLEE